MTAGALLALSSCTLLFNPDNLGNSGDGPDAMIEVPPDGRPLDPGEFGVTSVEPNTIYEGEGAAWAVPVVVKGQALTEDVTVVLDGGGFSQQEIPFVVASDGNSLAFPVRVPVLTELASGQTELITIRVRKDGVSSSIDLTVVGLDELTTSSLPSGTRTAADLDARYSRIVIDEDVTFAGTEPIRLLAMADIRLAAAISANGQEAAGDEPGEGGPGGCPGGALETAGACGAGGGRGAAGDDAAAGGGHFTIGTPGSGEPPAPGGVGTGRADMVPLANEAGNGGGGSRVGAGGGGGGIVELTSHGTFTVEATGSIAVDGGRGGDGICRISTKAGSGGGGSGGAILVRAWGGFDDQDTTLRLSARGGEGGDMPPDRNCVEVGGAGSAGRIRVDTAEPGGLPSFAQSSPEPFQGALFRNIDSTSTPVPVVTRLSEVTLDAFGQRGESFTLNVNGTRSSFSMSSDGAASVPITLAPGRNTICAVTGSSTALNVLEGVQCVEIVYMQ